MKKEKKINNLVLGAFKKSLYYRISLLISFFVSAIGYFDTPANGNLFETLHASFSNMYCLLALAFLFIVNIIYLYYYMLKNSVFILRNKNNEDYYKNSIKFIININNNLFFKYLSFAFLLAIVKSFGKISFEMYINYNIPLIIYVIFFIARVYFMINLISMIAYFLIIIFKNNNIPLILYIILFSYTFLNTVYDIRLVSSIWKIKIFFGYYLTGFNCTSFLLEISLSIIYIFCLYYLILFIGKIIKEKIKDYVI